MNLNEIIQPRDSQERILYTVRNALNHLLSLLGVFVFWLFMVALIASPIWVPALVNRFASH